MMMSINGSARAFSLAVAGWCMCTAANAQTAQQLHVRALAATCANCHGTDGRVVPGSGNAKLAGQTSEFIITQMRAFRDGTRTETVMHQLAKGYTDQQLEQIATYMAAQKTR